MVSHHGTRSSRFETHAKGIESNAFCEVFMMNNRILHCLANKELPRDLNC